MRRARSAAARSSCPKTDAVEGRAVRRDEGVGQLGEGREARHMPIEREPDRLARRVTEREETRLCGAGALPVGRDVLHRALKLGL